MKKIILTVLLMSLTVFAALTISAADFGAKGALKAEETHIGYLIPLFEKHGYNVPEDSANDHVVIPQDVRVVFEKLQAASENHLRAFNNGLRRY